MILPKEAENGVRVSAAVQPGLAGAGGPGGVSEQQQGLALTWGKWQLRDPGIFGNTSCFLGVIPKAAAVK